jgi:hypothetical protein
MIDERTPQEEAKRILESLGANPEMTKAEIYDYLKNTWKIKIVVREMKYNPNYGEEDEWNRDGWCYDACWEDGEGDGEWFTEDFQRYLTKDDAEWWGCVESLAFVSLRLSDKD